MGPETINKLKDSEIHGDFVGRDNITVNVTMFKDSEREFVVTHNADIKSVIYFTGREKELDDLRQRIEAGRKSVLVSGMGGIGKTHICRKLFEEYTNKHANGKNIPFGHIGYIEYNGDMGSSLQNCLKFKEQDNPEQNQAAAWKELEYLASGGKLLLFVDNVNVPIGEDAGLGKLKSIPGAVVLTSRRSSFSKEFELCRIGFLDTEQCMEIYERIRYEDSGIKIPEEEMPDLKYVIEEMAAWHTITVEFLAHLAETKRWTVKELRNELESKGFRLKYRNEEDKLINIQEEYEKLYDLSVLTEAEKNILEAFSVFPYIPLEAEICNQWLLEDARVSKDDDVLIGLYRKGWLQFDLEQACYAMHPVFAKFIFEKCKPKFEDHCRLVEECQECLEILEKSSVLACLRYIPFAENIYKKVDMEKDVRQVRLIESMAYLLRYTAEYKKAGKLYEELIEIHHALNGDQIDIAESYNNLVDVYVSQREYGKVKELCGKSIQIYENLLGENDPLVASGYSNLVIVYLSLGEYEKAEMSYEKSLEIYEVLLREEHSEMMFNYDDLASCYNDLICTYLDCGKYEKAKKSYEKINKIYKTLLREGHPEAKMVYKNIEILDGKLALDDEFKHYLEEKTKGGVL